MRTAATASMVSTARRNRAERKAITDDMQTKNIPQAASGLTQQLTELNDLKEKGILTQEEFDAKKKQLLGI